MASGLPVACSNASSLPEVVCEATLLFDPGDPGAMLDAVNQIWRDRELRDILKKRGLARSEIFSWGETARKVFEAFIEAAIR
jgi:alpha-1,3-rhamnosyl/mannosyltransferase